MADPVPAGSDGSAGTYQCTNCGNQIDVGSTSHLPPCPNCGNGEWATRSGGDAAADPDPDSQRRSAADVSREVLPREGAARGDELGRRALEDDRAAVAPGAGAEVDDPVGVRH